MTAAIVGMGIVIGAAVLLLGWKWGRSFPANQAVLTSEQMLKILQDLTHWTRDMGREVTEYRQLIEQLDSDPGTQIQVDGNTPRNAGVVTQIVAANHELQQRLNHAESTLKAQADSLVAFLSEARTDPLTKLPNRRAFDVEAGRHLASWLRHGRPFGLLVIDVDNFKSFNDQYGHLLGDTVLTTVARKLRQSCRTPDLLARLGGEEFVLLIPHSGASEAIQALERLRTAVEQASVISAGKVLKVTVSCGGALIATGESIAALVQRADDAMYASKRAGRNTCHWHDGNTCLHIQGQELIPTIPASDCPPTVRPAGTFPVAFPSQFHEVCTALRTRFEELTA